jgi:hypothetical protein
MIGILNICPICGSQRVYRFKEPERGDDLTDGPWGVPCTKCESSLFEQLECKSVPVDANMGSSEPVSRFFDVHVGCLYGDPSAINTARQVIGI